MGKSFGKLLIYIICVFTELYFYSTDMASISIILAGFILCCQKSILIGNTSSYTYGFDEKLQINYCTNLDHSFFLKKIKKSYILEAILDVALILGFFLNNIFVFIPIIIYDALLFKFRTPIFLSVFALLVTFLNEKYGLFFAIVMLVLLSIYIEVITINSELLNLRLKELRDTTVERDMLLTEKNRAIILGQDQVVYNATLKERNRIAREIHDNVGHMLTSSILQIGAAKTINKDEGLNPILDSILSTLNTAMSNIRSSVHDLHDESIDLKSAIEDIAKTAKGFNVKIDYSMEAHIPREVKYNFISIVKESVNNVEKHSNGDTITIKLIQHPAFYQLIVEDNGRDIAVDYNSGIGLTNIRDRVSNLKGNLKISTEFGFKIQVTILISEENKNENYNN